MIPSIAWYLFALIFTGGVVFWLHRDSRPYLPGGATRLSSHPIAGSEFLFGFWIVLLLFLFVPDATAFALKFVSESWQQWISQGILQITLVTALIILFRTKLKTWRLLEPSPHLQRRLFPISFIWFVLSLVLFIGVHTLWSNVMTSFGVEPKPQQALVESVTSNDPIVLTIIFISVVILAPIWEELLFRGLLFRFLYSKTGFWIAALISGLLFSAMHAILIGVGGLWALGIMFALAYRITGDIRVPILMHSFYNLNTLIMGRAFMDPSQFEEITACLGLW